MNNYKLQVMRKGLILILIAFLIPAIRLSAQNPQLEKLNAYKIAFYTKRLNLTSPDAEKFWPVYNEYQKQKNLIQLERNSIIRSFNQNENNLNDNQLTELGDKLISTLVQESSSAVTFHKKLKEILPPAKVIRFYQVENLFKAQLLNELQGNRQQQRGLPGRDF